MLVVSKEKTCMLCEIEKGADCVDCWANEIAGKEAIFDSEKKHYRVGKYVALECWLEELNENVQTVRGSTSTEQL